MDADPKVPGNAATLPEDTSAAIPVPSSTLTITYCSSDKGGETHAIVPFPMDYETCEQQAVTAALNILGEDMSDPTLQAKDVVLKCRKPRDKQEWIWAKFDPANWPLVVHPGSEVGLFVKQVPRSLAADVTFWHGPIYLVFGTTRGGLTTWTDLMIRGQPHNPKATHTINRPASYTEAVEATKECVRHHTGTAERQVHEPGKTLTFYRFQDTLSQWTQFPSQAVTNEKVWKATVPLPTGVMGVIAT
ncbi:hypothetical protein DFH06DRAFT_1310933, partial [Mycena polygramma]